MAARKICAIDLCPKKTVARIRDRENEHRMDLCDVHLAAAVKRYGDEIVVVDVWGEVDEGVLTSTNDGVVPLADPQTQVSETRKGCPKS